MKPNFNKVRKELCHKYSIIFHDIMNGGLSGWKPEDLEYYFRNKSSCFGCDEIALGLYTDDQLRIASFFHELGHCLIYQRRLKLPEHKKRYYKTKWADERAAWIEGFKQAKKYGFKFSKKTLAWCKKQLDTYKGWEKRQKSPEHYARWRKETFGKREEI